MEDYIDPEEEFMLMHQDEMELMAEMEEGTVFKINTQVNSK